jgi:aminoglycoside 2'-N-acetyltransferase I
MTPTMRVIHTAYLTDDDRVAIRGLLDATFERMTDAAYENTLGGMHVLLSAEGELVGHASLVQRRIIYAGDSLRAGYVEAVAVHADHRRLGYGALMMSELEQVLRSAYDLGALGASHDGARLYAARGWQLWRGPSAALTPDGVRRTADKDGWIYVLPVSRELDLSAELVCDWRPGELWLTPRVSSSWRAVDR